MKTHFLLIFSWIGLSVSAQSDIEKRKRETVAEARRLYESEMASWYGTDLFLAKFDDQSKIGGYFSYADNGKPTCIFFDRSDKPKTLGAVTFDKTFDLEKADVNLSSRDLTKLEMQYFELRREAFKAISGDTLFNHYNNTRLNIVPIVDKKESKVYVLTAATEGKAVIYGNDYVMLFDKKNKLKSAKKLHNGIIPFEYGNDDPEKKTVSSLHTHLPEYSDIMTVTDICTTMLYAKLTGWESAQVISSRYTSTWDCQTETLTVEKIDD